MSRWVYWISILAIATVIAYPAVRLATDPQADIRDLFRLGIDLEGGTSLIYELHAPEGGEAPDAKAAKSIILKRIDPNGTSGYIVRAVGAHRLEIVLPGRATKVRVTESAVTRESLTAAQQAVSRPSRQNPATAAILHEKSDAFLGGTRFDVRLAPPQYMEDVQTRIADAVRERLPRESGSFAVIGVEPSGDQWQGVAVLVATPPSDSKRVGEWKDLINSSLSAQRDVTRVKRLVRQAGFLEFRIVADKVKDRGKANFEQLVRDKQSGKPSADTQWHWYPMKKGWELHKQHLLDAWNFVYVVDEKSQTVEALVNVADGQDMTGRDLGGAAASVSEGQPVVSFRMKSEAGVRFGKLTNPENRKRQMAIILDGVIQSSPVLNATLTTGGIIEGYKDRRELEEVVTVLNSGQLAASLGDPVTERTVGPELGEDNIHKGLMASLVGFGVVVLFIAVYYLFAGLVANTALVLNLVLTICIMYWIRQTWTLPGIAGLILSLAMAVDANVLIYERLREEKGKEGSLAFALKRAYSRAFTTIFDSNLTTVIPAFVLLLPGLATEEVKGFAVVMIIGIGVSMFTAIVVTRMIFETGLRWGWIKELRMLHFFEKPNIDWMRFARFSFVSTSVAALVGIVAFVARGPEKYDIEFVGGTQVELALDHQALLKRAEAEYPGVAADKLPSKFIEMVRGIVAKSATPAATVQELEYSGETNEARPDRYLISVPHTGAAASSEAAVKDALSNAFAAMRPEGVGEKVQATASEITLDTIRRRLAAMHRAGPAASGPASTEAAPSAPAAEFIPPEERQFNGKVCITAELTPPMPLGEIQRRLERYPDMAGMLYRVEGAAPAPTPGDFKSFELWVRDEYVGKHAETPNPTFWADVVKLALGREETFASTTSFEPTMAGEAWDKAVIAILFSLAAMAVYIWFRFAKLSSGIAAVVATVHDVLIALGAVTAAVYLADTVFGTTLMLTDMKVNLPLVGAFLTLVGYSVNDTIVVFDRIRENRGKYGDLSASIINNSINQTLSRTVLTSSTVFLAVVALYFFGGKTSSIHGLAFVMLVGTVVGCYSSISIASPILVMADYLKKVYAWYYPIIGLVLLGYYAGVWSTPAVFFGSAVGWGWAVLQVGLVIMVTWAIAASAWGRPWSLLVKAPVVGRAVAAISLLAPLVAIVLGAIAVLAAKESGNAAWAGPAAVGALATCPATYLMYKMAWGKEEQKS